ncbi:MAG TPA: LptF/LptG family permease [Chthonomonadaceae bacterium]|nr:LptF/LptG family permease [Chthonomonadaceae bacterium]
MRLIDKLVFIDLIGPFLNGMVMFLTLLFAATYLFPATELLVRGIPLLTVIRLTLLLLPSILTQTFPMAMLLAGLLGLGRISADHEAVAIFAAGISFPRVVRIVLITGTLVSLIAFLWNDNVVPPASAAALRIRQEAEKHIQNLDKPLSYTVEGKQGVEEFVKIDGGFDAQTRTLRRVSIVKYSQDPQRQGQPEVLIYCSRAIANDEKGLDWTYYDGYLLPITPGNDRNSIDNSLVINFKELRALPRGASIGKRWDEVLSVQRDDPNSKSFSQLRQEIEAERQKGMDTGGKEVDLYGKISLPLASLIFGMVGAALGLNTQRGGGKTVGFGMAIFIVFLYWIFYHSMFVLGKGGSLPPMLASFLPDIVGAVVGVILTVRASR